MRLADKVALVTGAGSGFGRASAELFAKEGARVVVVDRDAATGAETVERIRGAGGEAIFVQADVTRSAEVKAMVQAALDSYGRLDVLFNNAGIGMKPAGVEDVPEEEWDLLFSIDVKGVWLGCKYAVPVMKAQGRGVILNMASIGALRPRPQRTLYSAAKGAVIAFTRALALEVAPHQIRVCSLSPVAASGPRRREKLQNSPDPESVIQNYVAGIPLGRMATMEDVAHAALYLASEEASFLTGVNLEVDGGRSL